MSELTHLPAEQRFESPEGGVLEYRLDGRRMLLTHTWVPPDLRGKGIAEKMVLAALETARTEGWKVVPICGYVDAFLRRHREFDDLRADA